VGLKNGYLIASFPHLDCTCKPGRPSSNNGNTLPLIRTWLRNRNLSFPNLIISNKTFQGTYGYWLINLIAAKTLFLAGVGTDPTYD